MANSIIDMRGTSYQPCWGCGQLAGGHDAHLYYGNFTFGIEHLNCGRRIEIILDRSLRALSTLDEGTDNQTQEIVTRALIITSARKLKNCTLNTIEEDQKIRSIVETEGMAAALVALRAISKLDDIEWDNRLKKHSEIMQGVELIQRELSGKDKLANSHLEELLKNGTEHERDRKNKCLAALDQMSEQLKYFSEKVENGQCKTPYCILKDIISPYYHNSDINGLPKLLKAIEAKGIWKVLFLAKESQDPIYTYITHVIVAHIALLPAETPVIKAKQFWQVTCGHQERPCANVLQLDCLEWKNHWVLIEEIDVRLSLGDGIKKRPLDV